MRDEVDELVEAWARERPDLDLAPVEVFSRISRLGRHLDLARRDAFTAARVESWEFDVLAALRRAGAPYELSPGTPAARDPGDQRHDDQPGRPAHRARPGRAAARPPRPPRRPGPAHPGGQGDRRRRLRPRCSRPSRRSSPSCPTRTAPGWPGCCGRCSRRSPADDHHGRPLRSRLATHRRRRRLLGAVDRIAPARAGAHAGRHHHPAARRLVGRLVGERSAAERAGRRCSCAPGRRPGPSWSPWPRQRRSPRWPASTTRPA